MFLERVLELIDCLLQLRVAFLLVLERFPVLAGCGAVVHVGARELVRAARQLGHLGLECNDDLLGRREVRHGDCAPVDHDLEQRAKASERHIRGYT